MAADLELRLTTAGLGGAPTGSIVAADPVNNIFDNVSFSEAASGDIEYRAIDLYNNGDEAAIDVEIYMSSPTVSASTQLDFGLDAVQIGSTISTGDESTAPVAVTFSYYELGTTLSLPNIPASDYCRIWIRRTVNAGAGNLSSDLGTIAFSYA